VGTLLDGQPGDPADEVVLRGRAVQVVEGAEGAHVPGDRAEAARTGAAGALTDHRRADQVVADRTLRIRQQTHPGQTLGPDGAAVVADRGGQIAGRIRALAVADQREARIWALTGQLRDEPVGLGDRIGLRFAVDRALPGEGGGLVVDVVGAGARPESAGDRLEHPVPDRALLRTGLPGAGHGDDL